VSCRCVAVRDPSRRALPAAACRRGCLPGR
jgi:hypothetical protein